MDEVTELECSPLDFSTPDPRVPNAYDSVKCGETVYMTWEHSNPPDCLADFLTEMLPSEVSNT